MVGPGDPAHHPGPARPVLAGHPVCPATLGGAISQHPAGGLVSESPTDLRRCAGPAPPRAVDPPDFFALGSGTRPDTSPPPVRGALDRDPVLRRVNSQSRAKGPSRNKFPTRAVDGWVGQNSWAWA